jgi:hypothetical protein
MMSLVGNVYGRKNVVMRYMRVIMVLYIGLKNRQNNEKKA